ncbi:MAG: hypothetical protein IPP69_10625 [Flavobacteriales bacterium]|nr:hypothetical protein [Flavobacteriales bacterium]
MKNLIWRTAAIAASIVAFATILSAVVSFFVNRTVMREHVFIYSILMSVLHYGVYIAAICFALVSFSKKNNGRITSSQAYGIGFATVLITVVIDLILGYLQFEYVSKPALMEMQSEYSAFDTEFQDLSYFKGYMLIAVFTSMLIRVLVMLIAIYFVGRWKLYQKAGEEGWASIIPIYNTYKLITISGNPGWYLLMLLIPIVNIVFVIMIMNGLSAQFGKGSGYTWGLIFLGIIFLPKLGFDEQSYSIQNGEYGDPSFGNVN